MGFKPREKIYTLDFSGTELDGLLITTVPISAEQFYAVSEIADASKNNSEFVKGLTPEFISVVREWNLENEDDTPVPVTAEALFRRLEFKDVTVILDAWLEAMVGVSSPLDQPSSGGDLSLVESLPMEPLSPSPTTLSVPS